MEQQEERSSTSIYFRDPVVLQRLTELAKILGISVSSLIERLAISVLADLEKKAPKLRQFRLEAEINL